MKNRKIIFIIIASSFTIAVLLAFFVVQLKIIGKESSSRCNFLYKQKKYEQAFSTCQKGSMPFDYFILGQLYEKGLGTDNNKKLALENYKKAASQGVEKAQMKIADNFAKQNNWERALELYSQASKKVPFAFVRQAEIYLIMFKNTKIKKYKKEAFELIQKGVESGSPIANIYMGYFYSIGYRVPKNLDQAIQYYEQFLSQTGTITTPSSSNRDSKPVDQKESYAELANLYLGIALYKKKQSIDKALNYLLKGKKTAISTFLIAKIYLDSTSKLYNSQEGLKWLKESVTLDNDGAMVKLAKLYQQGIVVKKDINKSISLFEKAANDKNVEAMLALANIYEFGDGVPVNIIKSQQWYTKAKELGSKEAEEKLNKKITRNIESRLTRSKCLQQMYRIRENRRIAYQQKKKIKPNYAKAFRICKKEHLEGNPIGTFYLGEFMYYGYGTQQNQKEGIKLIEQSADKGYTLATWKMADYYTFGICPKCHFKAANQTTLLKINNLKAKKYILQYAKDPLAKSSRVARLLYNLARSYWVGEGLKINQKLAFSYFKTSAELGYNNAQYRIGKIYNSPGYTFANFDRQKAIKWFTLAAETNTRAQRALCYIYASYPNHINHKKAYQWCSIAARTKSRRAMYYLATLYQFGFGIKQDIPKAKYWYQKSADKGYDLAIKALQNLN